MKWSTCSKSSYLFLSYEAFNHLPISRFGTREEIKETCLNHLENWEAWHKVDRDKFQMFHGYEHKCYKKNKSGNQKMLRLKESLCEIVLCQTGSDKVEISIEKWSQHSIMWASWVQCMGKIKEPCNQIMKWG